MMITNRFFDLDEAFFHQLPNLLLVNLPTKKNTKTIPRIHLKNKILTPKISLAKLASQEYTFLFKLKPQVPLHWGRAGVCARGMR